MLEKVLIVLAVGAVSGALAGFLLSLPLASLRSGDLAGVTPHPEAGYPTLWGHAVNGGIPGHVSPLFTGLGSSHRVLTCLDGYVLGSLVYVEDGSPHESSERIRVRLTQLDLQLSEKNVSPEDL